MLIGGAIFGALGFLFAPQLSKHILKGKKVLDDLLEEEEEEEEEKLDRGKGDERDFLLLDKIRETSGKRVGGNEEEFEPKDCGVE